MPVSQNESDTVALDLSLSLGSTISTKADAVSITELDAESPTFRGMEGVFVVPFSKAAPIQSEYSALPYVLILPSISGESVMTAYNSGSNTYASGLVKSINAHLYNSADASLPKGTSSVLIYGKAATASAGTDVELKHLNGSLLVSGIDVIPRTAPSLSTASSLEFLPEVLLEARVDENGESLPPLQAEQIVSALNDVVFGADGLKVFTTTAYYAVNPANSENWQEDEVTEYEAKLPWNGDIGDEVLRQCYEKMTADGALMFGSGSNVEALITSLYQTLKQYNIVQTNSPSYELERGGKVYELKKKVEDENGVSFMKLSYADMYIGVRDMVLKRIEESSKLKLEENSVKFIQSSVSTYPESLGFPSGAAVVRWTPTGYVVPLEDGMDGVAPLSHYCYPPVLYYYANTDIKTSDTESVRDEYTSVKDNADNTWNQVLNNYSDGAVTASTRSAALVDLMQYSVGMLCMSVTAKTESMLDHSKLISVPVTENAFPITGIIFGGQYAQRFDFTPIYSESATEYFLYDNLISGLDKSAQNPQRKEIYLRMDTGEDPCYFRVLSLQTPPEKSVYFALELENNSNVSFYGVEGIILPGQNFYLLGKLDVPPAQDSEGNPRAFDSVIVKDHYTMVNCVIPSFKNAHNAIPDLGIPQLGLGVEAKYNWTLSTPTTVLFE